MNLAKVWERARRFAYRCEREEKHSGTLLFHTTYSVPVYWPNMDGQPLFPGVMRYDEFHSYCFSGSGMQGQEILMQSPADLFRRYGVESPMNTEATFAEVDGRILGIPFHREEIEFPNGARLRLRLKPVEEERMEELRRHRAITGPYFEAVELQRAMNSC